MSNSTMDSPLKEHAYDGIQEFDNPLPGWWKWTFVATIVFSVFYLMYFHIGAPGRSIYDQYDRELAANTQLQFQEIGELTADSNTIASYMEKDSWLKVGQVVFRANCISCHGRDGEGKVGPNLTDDYYKNVRDLAGIARVIKDGAANGAMPAWGTRLLTNEIVLVSAYVAKMRGTNAAGGKPPEGSEIPPWSSAQEIEDGATEKNEGNAASAAPGKSPEVQEGT